MADVLLQHMINKLAAWRRGRGSRSVYENGYVDGYTQAIADYCEAANKVKH